MKADKPKTRRGNGFGTLISKGEGKPYLAKWVFAGKAITKSTGETNYNKALKVLEQLTRPYRDVNEIEAIKNLKRKIEDKSESLKNEEKKKNTIKLGELEDAFDNNLTFKDLRPRSISLAHYRIRTFVKWMNDNKKYTEQLKHIDKKTASEFLIYCSKYSPDAYNGFLKFFKRLWNVFKEEAGLEENIFESFKLRKIEESKKRDLTIEELYKVFNYIKDDEDLLCLFSMGLYFGGRLIDMSCAKWESVNFSNGTFNYIPEKTKKYGRKISIKIKKSLYNLFLKKYNEKGNSEYILPSCAKGYRNNTLRKKIHKIFLNCGIETHKKENGRVISLVSFHSLRHTFISLSLNSGNMSSVLVQKLVGHSNLAQTEDYFRKNDDVVSFALDQFPEMLDGNNNTLIDHTINDEDIKLLKSVYDKDKDRSLSDVVKRLVEFYRSNMNVIEIQNNTII